MKKIKMFAGVKVNEYGVEKNYKDLEVLKAYDFGEYETEIIRNLIIAFPNSIGTNEFNARIISNREAEENNIKWEKI